MQVTSETSAETIVVHKNLYCSCTEVNDVDLILPQYYLNLNQRLEENETSLVMLKSQRNKFGVKSVTVSIERAHEPFTGSLAKLAINEAIGN